MTVIFLATRHSAPASTSSHERCFAAKLTCRLRRHLSPWGLVVSRSIHGTGRSSHSPTMLRNPSEDLLSIPFILSFCIISEFALAFEIPADLRANWVFAVWIDPDALQTRPIARKILLTFSLAPLVPICFVSSAICGVSASRFCTPPSSPPAQWRSSNFFSCVSAKFHSLALIRRSKAIPRSFSWAISSASLFSQATCPNWNSGRSRNHGGLPSLSHS